MRRERSIVIVAQNAALSTSQKRVHSAQRGITVSVVFSLSHRSDAGGFRLSSPGEQMLTSSVLKVTCFAIESFRLGGIRRYADHPPARQHDGIIGFCQGKQSTGVLSFGRSSQQEARAGDISRACKFLGPRYRGGSQKPKDPPGELAEIRRLQPWFSAPIPRPPTLERELPASEDRDADLPRGCQYRAL